MLETDDDERLLWAMIEVNQNTEETLVLKDNVIIDPINIKIAVQKDPGMRSKARSLTANHHINEWKEIGRAKTRQPAHDHKHCSKMPDILGQIK